MHILSKKKIVLLGMMTKFPVAGAVWGTVQYLIGLRRLGYDVYYVEAHGRTPTMLMRSKEDDSSTLAAAFVERVMRRFDLQDKWAFHALHADGRCFGMTNLQLNDLYGAAELIINFHGATVPLPEHRATGRLVYLETDPVELEIELYHGLQPALNFLRPHSAFFTWGLNFNRPDCLVPMSDAFHFIPSCPVVVQDLWNRPSGRTGETFTTIGNWRQPGEVKYQGETYTWSKHHEFMKFIDLPRRTAQPFELALGSFEDDDRRLLETHGWSVRRSMEFSTDLDAYRDYIIRSRGEFTVAKDQNVRLRSGWFSERSAQYLAAGRPVITQETGFSNVLPTGEGLFGFSTMDEILAAVEAINTDYQKHSLAATEIARTHFNYDVVLKKMLSHCGVSRSTNGTTVGRERSSVEVAT
jgi:hypothetical protein